MNLKEIASSGILGGLQPSIAGFRLYRQNMPALSPQKLNLGLYIGAERMAIRAATGGMATFLLKYKGKEGALMCLNESEDETSWDVIQVKGADSQVSYRVSTSLDYSRFFGRLLKNIVDDTQTKVSSVRMVPFHRLIGIEQVPTHRMEGVQTRYAKFRASIGMLFDEEQDEYVYHSLKGECFQNSLDSREKAS
jgi:hypothetical protein